MKIHHEDILVVIVLAALMLSFIVKTEHKIKERDQQSRGKPLNEQIGGMLNPTWVERLMGWPLGWTDLKPLEMGKFRERQKQHGNY